MLYAKKSSVNPLAEKLLVKCAKVGANVDEIDPWTIKYVQ